MLRVLAGVLCGWLLVALLLAALVVLGRFPVAATDPTVPGAAQAVKLAIRMRMHREPPARAPIDADEMNLLAGARVYREQCASCHGLHGQPATLGTRMAPAAPQLWEARPHGEQVLVGVSGREPGYIRWTIVNGMRFTGMPAYKGLLNETESWQVSLLLTNADKPLPPGALALLRATAPTEKKTEANAAAKPGQ